MHRGEPDIQEITAIRTQLEALKANYGTEASSGSGVTIDDMNQDFTAAELDDLTEEVLTNLSIALELIESAEHERYSTTKRRSNNS